MTDPVARDERVPFAVASRVYPSRSMGHHPWLEVAGLVVIALVTSRRARSSWRARPSRDRGARLPAPRRVRPPLCRRPGGRGHRAHRTRRAPDPQRTGPIVDRDPPMARRIGLELADHELAGRCMCCTGGLEIPHCPSPGPLNAMPSGLDVSSTCSTRAAWTCRCELTLRGGRPGWSSGLSSSGRRKVSTILVAVPCGRDESRRWTVTFDSLPQPARRADESID